MLHNKLKEDLKTAMMKKDEIALNSIRLLLSACTNLLVEKKQKPTELLDDDDVIKLLNQGAKQRRESIEIYKKQNETERIDIEKKELEVIERYLPEQLSEEEVLKVIKQKMEELKITSKDKMGQLVGAVLKDINNQADGSIVSRLVAKELS